MVRIVILPPSLHWRDVVTRVWDDMVLTRPRHPYGIFHGAWSSFVSLLPMKFGTDYSALQFMLS